MLQRKIARKIKSDDGESKKVIRAYNKYIHFFSMTVGFLLALYVMGANVSTIFHSGGLIAIAFAFVMKSFAENFLAGLTIRIDGLIKPGDILESNGEIVKVKELGIRGVVGITRDLKDIVIPNSQIITERIVSYTYGDSFCQIWTAVGVTYHSDLKIVRRVLQKISDKYTVPVKKDSIRVRLVEFGNSSVNYKVGIWIKDPWSIREKRSEFNEAIWWALKDAGIVIAFPQLDVHFDDEATKHPALDSVTEKTKDK